MHTSTALLIAALASVGLAQRPADVSICDYYTEHIFPVNNATNQKAVIVAVVNTAVIGNYTHDAQKTDIAVPGILAANATYNSTSVNLLPYFDGSLASSNQGGAQGVSVNFLDGGGATPLTQNMPANGNSSNQYALLTHLYEYFGAVLGCTEYGKTGFPTYAGETSMYNVHKYMALDAMQVGYFIEQVGLSAASWGVSADDCKIVGTTLEAVFGHKCSAPAAVLPADFY
ncbi:hypothetical protein LTR62_004838 [Meristemomyces frigidus]|uniref:Uncharacterized protein n=1 Tax=Meristemomyces frigidus TaxID=1508187 RepID=A0AAN7TLG2_9PEZI|nr:hypothetical protein LTR62_004838 [Meristemomyces frigidus]